MAQTQSLSDMMDFDHLITVTEDGEVKDSELIVYFELVDGELQTTSPGWSLLNGFSGQYGYAGPLMHSSEQIGGGLERHIRETPGDYVALVNVDADGEATGEWAIAFRERLEDIE